MNSITEKLSKLGFTAQEADIYLFLLQNGTSTGYAVSKAIGKAIANTYKGIENLRLKGAVEVSDTKKSRTCRAVPWRLLLANQRKKYEDNLAQLETALETLPKPRADEAVYQLDGTDHVLTTAIDAIDSAKAVILGDIEPVVLPYVQSALERAAARGVEVRVKIYEPADIKGVHITLRVKGRDVYSRTNDVALHINVDGNNDVLAVFSRDMGRVLQAFTTQSALMNMKHYCALLYELTLTDIKQNLRSGNFDAAITNLDDTDHLQPFSANGPPLEGYLQNYDR